MGLKNSFDGFYKSMQEYLDIELEIFKLRAINSSSKMMAALVTMLFLVFFAGIITLMLGMWLGFFLSELLNNMALGFGLAAIIYLALFIILLIFQKKILRKPIFNAIIQVMLKNMNQKDE